MDSIFWVIGDSSNSSIELNFAGETQELKWSEDDVVYGLTHDLNVQRLAKGQLGLPIPIAQQT